MEEDPYSKVVRIYMKDRASEPIPFKFYRDTPAQDIKFMVQESIANLRHHSKNPNLRAWQGARCLDDRLDWDQSKESIVLSEVEPPVQVPAQSKPALQTSNKDLSKVSTRTEEKLSFATPNKQHVVHSKPSPASGHEPIVERALSQNASPTTNVSSPNKKRSGSAAKLHLSMHKSQIEKLGAPKNDLLKASATSHHKQENSITFNPLRNQSFTVDQSIASSHVFKSNAPGTFALAQENSQMLQPDANVEESKILVTTPQHKQKENTHPPTGEIGTRPLDGNVPHVYSLKRGMGPFSYFVRAIEDKYMEKLPPPLYMEYEVLSKYKDISKENILKGLEMLASGELKLVDEEILKQQKGILGEVLSSLVKSIAEGRGVVGVSLPVRIFEPRSLLERICDWWTFIPEYVIPAAQLTDPVERMKRVVSTAIGGLYVSAKQLKPFNPLLGETFQAVFPEHNITIDSEHTSHHPPIANFLLKHKDFMFWGRYVFIANVEGFTKNVVVMHQDGPNHVDFKDGHRITFYWPKLRLEGVMHGERTCTYTHHMKFVDEKNKIKVIIKFGDSGESKAFPKKRTDAFHGKMYRYKPEAQGGSKKQKAEELNFGDMEQEICSMHGSWLEYLKIGGQETWNIDNNKPAQYIPIRDPLPSDSRFREDLLWVKRENKKHAHEWKLKLEERQRYERKLRIDYQKHSKKH